MHASRNPLYILAIALALGATLHATKGQAQNPSTMNTPAPELTGGPWLNTDGKPVSLAERKGKVTIVEFWTFGCSNCQANLPAYARLSQKFATRDVALIGVHTPETATERDPKNVRRRVKDLGITYPVLLDAEMKNWTRWNQRYWPTVYLVDKAGKVRFRWEGELEYGGAGGEAKIEKLLETLLAETTPAVQETASAPSPATAIVNLAKNGVGRNNGPAKNTLYVCNVPGKCTPHFQHP